jgi:diguanylate cyclase (GGDEF)-like protein/PAS domain S-box-containing protein
VHPDDVDRAAALWRKAIETRQYYHAEFRLRGPDGGYRDIEARAAPLLNDDGTVREWIGTTSDISERKRAERRVAEEAHRLRSVLDSIHAYVGIIGPDGTLKYANAASLRGAGVDAGELVGRPLGAAMAWGAQDNAVEWSRQAISAAMTGQPFRKDVQYLDGQGRRGYLDLSLAPVYDPAGNIDNIIAFGVDITERRRLDDRLRASEETLRVAVESANIGLWDWNVATGAVGVPHWRVWSHQLGYSIEELPKHIDDFEPLIHPDDLPRAKAEAKVFLESPSRGYRTEFRIRHKDGNYRWILSQASLQQDDAGNPARMFGVHIDVTERRLAEEGSQRRARQRAEVVTLGINALSGSSLDEVMQSAVKVITDTLGVGFAEIFEVQPNARSMRLRAGHGWNDSDAEHLRLEVGHESFPGYVLLRSEFVACPDHAVDTRFAPGTALAGRGVRSSIGTIIRGRGGCYGVLAAHACRAQAFDEDDANFLQSVADVVATAVDRSRVDERMRHLAHHDDLTNLPNRRMMRESLGRALTEARTRDERIALMFIDLDHFKLVNDSLGHTAGDGLLQAVALRMRSVLKHEDLLCRLGGDEFVVIIRAAPSNEQLAAIAARLTEVFKRPIRVLGQDVFTTATMGIAVFPKDAGDVETLVRHADAALNRGKELGRNRVEFFSVEIEKEAQRWLSIKSGLQSALEHDELRVVYQPKIELASGKIIGAEALLRWNSPQLGEVSPAQFIPIAEAAGLIDAIGDFVLRQACRQAREWAALGHPGLHAAVNLSATQFRHPDLVGKILNACRKEGIEPNQIELEITEGVAMADADSSRQTLEELNRVGFRLAIDDFGTGYSSLNYLKRFYVDTLKIDRSFVRDLPGDTEDAAIARSIIALARSLGIGVTAEGVETREQLEFLRRSGCDAGQGFYFSPGVPSTVFSNVLKKDPWVISPAA